MADEQEIHITFTAKQAVAVIASMVAILATYPVANMVTPNARVDPFTGTQAEELNDRITYNEHQIRQIIKDDNKCEQRQDAMSRELGQLRELVTTYQSSAKQRDAAQEWKLDECMKRTQRTQ